MYRSPAGMIARLDASLARTGQDVVLRRNTLGPNSTPVPFLATVRGHVRGYKPEELTSTIIQGDSMVILSPTGIDRAGWPGPTTGTITGDRRVPRKGDAILVQETPRQVMDAEPIYVAGVLVRINVQVRGQAG